MDPTACLRRLLDACLDDDAGEVSEAAANLADWCGIGGTVPQIERMDDAPHFTVRIPWQPVR